jgi:hypothetical protein
MLDADWLDDVCQHSPATGKVLQANVAQQKAVWITRLVSCKYYVSYPSLLNKLHCTAVAWFLRHHSSSKQFKNALTLLRG